MPSRKRAIHTGTTVSLSLRLRPTDLSLLDWVAEQLHSARPGAVAIAIRHLAASLERGDPINMVPTLRRGETSPAVKP